MKKPTTAEQILIDLWRCKEAYNKKISEIQNSPSILAREIGRPDLLSEVKQQFTEAIDNACQSGYCLAKKYNLEVSDAERDLQRRSFAYGNTRLKNKRITREIIDLEDEKLKAHAEMCREVLIKKGY